VATTVLGENILMIDRIRNKGYFDCAVPIHTPANINAVHLSPPHHDAHQQHPHRSRASQYTPDCTSRDPEANGFPLLARSKAARADRHPAAPDASRAPDGPHTLWQHHTALEIRPARSLAVRTHLPAAPLAVAAAVVGGIHPLHPLHPIHPLRRITAVGRLFDVRVAASSLDHTLQARPFAGIGLWKGKRCPRDRVARAITIPTPTPIPIPINITTLEVAALAVAARGEGLGSTRWAVVVCVSGCLGGLSCSSESPVGSHRANARVAARGVYESQAYRWPHGTGAIEL